MCVVNGKISHLYFVDKLSWMYVARACFIKSRASLHLKQISLAISAALHISHTHTETRRNCVCGCCRRCSDLDSTESSRLNALNCHLPRNSDHERRESKMHLTLVYCVVGKGCACVCSCMKRRDYCCHVAELWNCIACRHRTVERDRTNGEPHEVKPQKDAPQILHGIHIAILALIAAKRSELIFETVHCYQHFPLCWSWEDHKIVHWWIGVCGCGTEWYLGT